MSRYIDIEPILEWCDNPEVFEPYGVNSVELERKIRQAPSIDIVFCKECKYFIDNLTEDATDEMYDACRWDWKRRIPTADDFCSYGERKESE